MALTVASAVFFHVPLVALADGVSVSVTVSVFECSDGLDNDSDSLIDYPSDTECSGPLDSTEKNITHCSDGLDNDSDGRTDFPDDTGCDSSADTSEADPVIQVPTSGGGGGGGGSSSTSNSQTGGQITFQGKAYPRSSVTVLKGAQVVSTTIAGLDATFSVSLSNITAGNHVFALYSEDDKGIRSSLLSFPVSVTAGAATTVGGIFMAPTIASDKSEVKRGDPIVFFGQTFPKSSVNIQVHSENEVFAQAKADDSGVYVYQLNSGLLEAGSHTVKSNASKAGEVSTYSQGLSFIVGSKNVSAELPRAKSNPADVNLDKKVNLVDFSIVAYWYKRASPPANVDMNKDGKVDLVDLSILVFNWTG